MIPPHLLQSIKEATDLPALVAEYGIPMLKSGRDFLILCPKHTDKTPSARLYRDHFFCFSCQAHGSVIDWVMLHEKCSFTAAVTALAERAGISLDHKPVTKLQAVYASEEAGYCKWWWEHYESSLISAIHSHVADEDYDTAGALSRINVWVTQKTLPEKFQIFREHRTDIDRQSYAEYLIVQADRFDTWNRFMDRYFELRWAYHHQLHK